MTEEEIRLNSGNEQGIPWRKWGPYLSERQWGTVREDTGTSGDVWNSFTHDQARSRSYRWGEDGIAGISDDQQRLCFSIALWNHRDTMLKERLFGLTNAEGNHGEDVKEYYFYLDNTPTHSYMKYLYKYPQGPYPYAELVKNNQERTKAECEYELLDTGIFEEDRYFDVFVEYAKETPETILIRIALHNRGPEPATLDVLPSLWFRRETRWEYTAKRPRISEISASKKGTILKAIHYKLGQYVLEGEGISTSLFTENETNRQRVFGEPNTHSFVKDGINECVVHGRDDLVNPDKCGTKSALRYSVRLAPGQSKVLRLRLRAIESEDDIDTVNVFKGFKRSIDSIFASRQEEADRFYSKISPPGLNQEDALIMRQALAGMLWTKQYYYYDVDKWLKERGANPIDPKADKELRNIQWHHMYNGDVLSMPDKWEYPWYAAWDLAFHVIALTLVDPAFGKEQLDLMLRGRYMHPNGQIPAYEWNFGDVNPPIHAWSTIFTYRLDKAQTGVGDISWLKTVFSKLLLNFTWWVNRKDVQGRNVFEGGFLGLDNISVFDRNHELPDGGYLEQADGTAWMVLFCQNMLEISTELAMSDSSYVDMVIKFQEHYLWIAGTMSHLLDDSGMWDEEDGFFYDVLRAPDGSAERLKVRSIVGLLPFCAATVFERPLMDKYPEIEEHFGRFLGAREALIKSIHDPRTPGVSDRRLAAILDEQRLRRVLSKMLDENEFLSPYGLRSLSRYHADHPYVKNLNNQEYRVGYLPAESDSGMFGGNSNWRGPVWMPINALVIRALFEYYMYYGDDFKVECPTGSGTYMTLYEVAEELSTRIAAIFRVNEEGHRPVYGGSLKFQEDPYWKDYILFYEYFHGDNGAGMGASHQTGWTGIVARMFHLFGTLTPEVALAGGNYSYHKRSAEALDP